MRPRGRRFSAGAGWRAFLTAFLLPAAVATASALIVFRLLLSDVMFSEGDETAWVRDATRLVLERYIDPVDPDRLAFDAIAAIVHRDPYSEFISPVEEERFREENEGRYVGIGFVLYGRGEPVTVLYAFPDSPAARAGLEPGDRIVAVDGESVEGKSLDEIVGRIKIRNGEGKSVRLRVRPFSPPGAPPPPEREVNVVRRTIFRPSVVDPRILDSGRGIGYVRLLQFQQHTADELGRAVDGLKQRGVRSLVLDLRGNRGGLLDEAVEVVSLFLEEGVVLRTEGRTKDSNRVYRTSNRVARHADLPLVLLVDDETASAAEIVAGALQDHFRAVLLGDRTFGKGMVQSVIPRRYVVHGEEKTARIKITTARYYTPGGRCIERRRRLNDGDLGRSFDRGLHPDVFLPVKDKEERRWLRRYLADREIPDETWRLIEERCPEQPHTVEKPGGPTDRQLAAARDWLAGGFPVSTIDP